MALSPSICGVILAGGASTRMGRDKALLPWPPVAEGTPAANTFLGAIIDLLQPFTDLVIVVAGKNAVALEPIAYAHNAFIVVNHAPEHGQFSSLRVGLHEVLSRGRDAALVALVDHPPVLPVTVQEVRDAFFNADPDVWTIVPEVKRGDELVHGHPIIVGREMIEIFLRAPQDTTAREIEHQYQKHVRYLPVNDARVATNIDTPEDYERLLRANLISSEKEF